MSKQSYADRIRGKLIKDAEVALNSSGKGGNEFEFYPDFGSHVIRLLPPVKLVDGKLLEAPDLLFYHTHSYHWIPSDVDDIRSKKGKYLWTRKNYKVDGRVLKDPIDEAVQQFYSVGRKEKNEDYLTMGRVLKRKRNFFCNIILQTNDGPIFKILTDRTKEGKLMRLFCKAMGIPFWKDVDDNWVEESTAEIDPDRNYFDLLDIDEGYDFKIVKVKDGSEAWDISYEDSFVIEKNSRALTNEERELLKQRVDLTTHIEYEESYNNVKVELDNLIGSDAEEDDGDEGRKEASTPAQKINIESKKEASVVDTKEEVVDSDDESAIDDLLDELDEE